MISHAAVQARLAKSNKRSALVALGCAPSDDATRIVERFEAHRLDCEIAAIVKFRRATTKLLTVEITASDLAVLQDPRAA